MLDEVISVDVVRRFCHVASHRLGVAIDAKQHALVAGRVAKRLQALDVGIDEYMCRLDEDHECNEVVGFLDFLRPRPPRVFARREDHIALHAALVAVLKSGKRRIRLWSAGCGTGEEAYGMALTALAAVEAAEVTLPDLDIKVLATDLSKTILQRGKQGVFDDEQLRDVPPTMQARYFHATENGTVLDESLKELVYFRRLNLSSLPFPMTGPFEAIFCEQGLAPMVAPARKRALAAVQAVLVPGGLLCTGLGPDPLDDGLDASDETGDAMMLSGANSRPRYGHC